MLTKVLELGVGDAPSVARDAADVVVWHDRTKHADYIDTAHDLNVRPWPWFDAEFDTVVALDVFEHLRLETDQWLSECWRILRDHGRLIVRLPAADNPLSYRDPTHRRFYHPETLHYFDPEQHHWQRWGRIYDFEPGLWKVESVERTPERDLLYLLTKRPEATR